MRFVLASRMARVVATKAAILLGRYLREDASVWSRSPELVSFLFAPKANLAPQKRSKLDDERDNVVAPADAPAENPL